MTAFEELETVARQIVAVRDGKMVSPELSRIGDDIFANADPIERLAALISMLPGICVHALLLSNLGHVKVLRKDDYQRLFNLLRGHEVATYDLTRFLVHFACVRGPVLRELAGDSKPFGDIAKYQMADAILGDGLAQEPTIFPLDGRRPHEVTVEWYARWNGSSAAEELAAFRDDIKVVLS